eukprot:1182761-Karenia_brevis.AAC.1
MKAFKRDCKRRHNERSDVKKRDVQRLRSRRFEELMTEIGQDEEHRDLPRHRIRDLVVGFIKATIDDVETTFLNSTPFLKNRAIDIMSKYTQLKQQEAAGDEDGIVQPEGGSICRGRVNPEAQWLDKISNSTYR